MSYSYTVLQKKDINVFRIPAVTNIKGHYFASWKDKIWRGNLKINQQGESIWVELINYDGTLYAKAILPENYHEGVQKTQDSSRGYALRLTSDDGRTMWIGLGFHDRNDAFDFFSAFQRFEEQRDMERNPQKYHQSSMDMSKFRMNPNQKIVIGGLESQQQSQTDNFNQDPFQAFSGFQNDLGTGSNEDPFSSFKISAPEDDDQQGGWGAFNSNQTEQNQGLELLGDNPFEDPAPANQDIGEWESVESNPFRDQIKKNLQTTNIDLLG